MNFSSAQQLSNPIAHMHYRDLPAAMYTESNPSASPAATLVELNVNLLDQLGVNSPWFHSEQGLSVLSGNSVNQNNLPISLAYSGHQFGHWVPILGDGRTHMLGQIMTSNGFPIDVQLKGSGRTRFSRNGDGRATLGAVLREYIVSEAMAGLGIPTTRSLAIIGTGEYVVRERKSPGAILVRTASSHIRVGTFQYACASLDEQSTKSLADFVIARYFPELEQQTGKYLKLLDVVIERQASLIAKWMLVGFIHGVMNTDNMSIVGETIDYGPCAFMDEFQPDKVFSSIDQSGRYAWDQQPAIAHWNLSIFAQKLLPLLHSLTDEAVVLANTALEDFPKRFQLVFQNGLIKKFGFQHSTDSVIKFIESTFEILTTERIDFTVFFDRLTGVAAGATPARLIELFGNNAQANTWLESWHKLRSKNATAKMTMRKENPAVIARNHRVEEAIEAAIDNKNFEPFRRLCRVLEKPFDIDDADRDLQAPPKPEERITKTFCGT